MCEESIVISTVWTQGGSRTVPACKIAYSVLLLARHLRDRSLLRFTACSNRLRLTAGHFRSRKLRQDTVELKSSIPSSAKQSKKLANASYFDLWTRGGSNSLPLVCHTSALPSELRAQVWV